MTDRLRQAAQDAVAIWDDASQAMEPVIEALRAALAETPSVDALIADLFAATRWDYLFNRGEIEWESSPIGDWIKETDILNIINKYRAQS